MRNRLRRAIVVAALGVLGTVAFSSMAAAQDPCAYTGAGTDKLCVQWHLAPGQYLTAAADEYRFWFQFDGAGVVYRWGGSDWVALYTLFPPSPRGPAYSIYGEPSPGFPEITVTLHAYDRDGAMYFGTGTGGEGIPDGQHFLRLDADGCVRIYDRGGARRLLGFTPAEHPCPF